MESKIIRFDEDYRCGLNSEQVRIRNEEGNVNLSPDDGSKSISEIIRDNLLTYFNVIFLVLTILVCVAKSYRSLTFLPVIIGNILIGIIQEIRAKKVLEKMNLLNVPHVTVIRDGEEKVIPSEELVLDEIVLFRAGNQIPADGTVIFGEAQVNESLLTGEADEITKDEGMELRSGSFVVSGECYARIERVGEKSYISKVTAEARTVDHREQSEMVRSINKLVKWVGVAIIPIGIILFYQGYFINQESFQESIVSMVAAIIGMIPEGLYLLTTMALAVSTIRLAQKKVLLHDMKSIETLARVDILCVDKTGTITENKMMLNELIKSQDYIDSEEKYLPLDILLGDFVNNMTRDNITMETLQSYFTNNSGKKAISMTGFSSAVKYSSVTFDDGVYVLGAPEMILREDYRLYEKEISEHVNKGYRVLVFGRYDGVIDGKALTGRVIPLGFITLSNRIREKAKETFQYFNEQGVTVKVISGDNPETVSEVARQAGIVNADSFVDVSTLKDKRDLYMAAGKYTVFGRVTPKQKQLLVRALKKAGHTVAMTGDGVNDILAMKDADCSIAMASGSEAAAQASQLVLLESDFSCMPFVVLEGRRVVNNIQRSASLFLVKNIFSLIMSIFSAVFMITYPLEPSQISLISMFTIGIPAFFLALEPNRNRIEGKFLTNVFLKALPAGITDILAVASLVMCGHVFRLPSADISTAATMLLAIVGFMILNKISKPLNRIRTLILAGNVAALFISGIFLNDLFALNRLSKIGVLLFVVFSFASESVFRYLTIGIEKLQEIYEKRKKS